MVERSPLDELADEVELAELLFGDTLLLLLPLALLLLLLLLGDELELPEAQSLFKLWYELAAVAAPDAEEPYPRFWRDEPEGEDEDPEELELAECEWGR